MHRVITHRLQSAGTADVPPASPLLSLGHTAPAPRAPVVAATLSRDMLSGRDRGVSMVAEKKKLGRAVEVIE
jgi:hypothetical protein